MGSVIPPTVRVTMPVSLRMREAKGTWNPGLNGMRVPASTLPLLTQT